MDEEQQKLLARAKSLEGKMLYVKAAEIYLKLDMNEPAAIAYEKCSAYDKAEVLYKKAGKTEAAERCKKKRDEASSGKTWLDMQSDFQKDAGNPY